MSETDPQPSGPVYNFEDRPPEPFLTKWMVVSLIFPTTAFVVLLVLVWMSPYLTCIRSGTPQRVCFEAAKADYRAAHPEYDAYDAAGH